MTQIDYMLRTCNADMTSHGGFKWPTLGPVTCPDWDPEPVCGYGLHGLLRGQGNINLLDPDSPGRVWQVVAVPADEIVDLGGKIKVPRAWVVFSGSRGGAVAHMQALCPGA